MSRRRVIARVMVFALLISIGFVGGMVAAYSPQRVPPRAQANKLEAIANHLQVLKGQLERCIPESESVLESNAYNALLEIRSGAEAIRDYTLKFRPESRPTP